ncbi:MAG: major capsid protein P2 [Pseudomonadota bacterium]
MYYDQMIDFQNKSPGNVAVLKLSYNATFDKLHFQLGGGLTKADIGRIEGKANGVSFFVDDGSLMELRDAYAGVFTDSDTLTLDFTEPNTKGGASAQYLASLPRNLLTSLTFELTISADADPGMTLGCTAEYRDPTVNPFILRRKDFTVPMSVTGENDFMLPSGMDGGLIKRVWIHHGGNVTKAELRTNGTPRIRAVVAQIEYAQKRNRVVPQEDILVLDFIADGNLMGMLNTAQVKETLLRITTSAPDQARVFVDYIDDLRKLH